jgi:hypothetical protein
MRVELAQHVPPNSGVNPRSSQIVEPSKPSTLPGADTVSIAQPPTKTVTTVWMDEGKKAIYEVRDRDSGQVIYQVPSDEVLRGSRNIAASLKQTEHENEHGGHQEDLKS